MMPGLQGDDLHCNTNVPVVVRKSTFCDTYMAEARVFRTYASWILSMMLNQERPSSLNPKSQTHTLIYFKFLNPCTRNKDGFS